MEVRLSDHHYVGENSYKLSKFKLPFSYEWTSCLTSFCFYSVFVHCQLFVLHPVQPKRHDNFIVH